MNKKSFLISFLLFLGIPLMTLHGLNADTPTSAAAIMLAQAGPEPAPAPPADAQPALVAPEPVAAPAAGAPEVAPAPETEPAQPAETTPVRQMKEESPARVEARKEPHTDYAQMLIKECSGCHRGMGVTPNHGADWSREHRVIAEKAGSNCADCHQQSFCLDCHVGGGIEPDLSKSVSRRGDYMPRTHLADFVSLHPVKALDNPQNCYRCHDAAYCYDCHSRMQKNTLNVKSHTKTFAGQQYVWSSEHSREARRNLQSCQTCHPEGNVCMSCHSATSGFRVNPHPKDWDGSKLKSKGGDRSCRVCH